MWQSSVRSTYECEIAKAAPTLMPTLADGLSKDGLG